MDVDSDDPSTDYHPEPPAVSEDDMEIVDTNDDVDTGDELEDLTDTEVALEESTSINLPSICGFEKI